jgi:hypothetical protein
MSVTAISVHERITSQHCSNGGKIREGGLTGNDVIWSGGGDLPPTPYLQLSHVQIFNDDINTLRCIFSFRTLVFPRAFLTTTAFRRLGRVIKAATGQ